MTRRATGDRRGNDDVDPVVAAVLAAGVSAWGIGIATRRVRDVLGRRGKDVVDSSRSDVVESPAGHVEPPAATTN